MIGNLRVAYETELSAARRARAEGNYERAFHHLGRAHILSQRFTWRHVQVHWRMLSLGIARGDWHEVFGQLSRVVAAGLFSRIWVPAGNTGRANVSALKPMPMPDDLRTLLEEQE
jgi:hypothetical protein